MLGRIELRPLDPQLDLFVHEFLAGLLNLLDRGVQGIERCGKPEIRK